MVSLLETLIGFVAIMLVLSYLVKSLTSVVKNYIDFYKDHLEVEVSRLVQGTLGETWDELRKIVEDKKDLKKKFPWVMDIHWERLGEDYLNKENMEWVLRQLADVAKEREGTKFDQGQFDNALKNLEGRLKVHLNNLRYVFDRQMKNVALVAGLVLCLGLNINAFTIWTVLYNDHQLRATFAGPYAQEALKLGGEGDDSGGSEVSAPSKANMQAPGTPSNLVSAKESPEEAKKKLREGTEKLLGELVEFQSKVGFGLGRIYEAEVDTKTVAAGQQAAQGATVNGKSKMGFLLYEFFGSLLTGILVSIGAPYWHDLLRALIRLRGGKEPAGGAGQEPARGGGKEPAEGGG